MTAAARKVPALDAKRQAGATRKRPGHRLVDITGHTYGRLTVLRRGGSGKRRQAMWACACTCGKTVEVIGRNLRSGNSKSCGCWNDEVRRTRPLRHGCAAKGKVKSEYVIWKNIIRRCESPTCASYARYGARGITICGRWRSDFGNFLADMGPRPSRDHSVERVDNDGPYSPDNCRWATRFEQGANKRSNRLLTCQGRTMHLAAWSRESGINRATIETRLDAGVDTFEAIFSPVRKSGSK